jgi:hypothetical protein
MWRLAFSTEELGGRQNFSHLGHSLVLKTEVSLKVFLQKFKNKLSTYKANSLSH